MANTNQFNAAAYNVSLNGKKITDFAKDSIIEVAPVGDIGGYSYGADGGATGWGSAIRGVTVKLSVRQNSQGNALLDALQKQQLNKSANGGAIDLIDISITDKISGSVLVRNQGIFKTAPTKSVGAEPGTMDYMLEVPQGMANAVEKAA